MLSYSLFTWKSRCSSPQTIEHNKEGPLVMPVAHQVLQRGISAHDPPPSCRGTTAQTQPPIEQAPPPPSAEPLPPRRRHQPKDRKGEDPSPHLRQGHRAPALVASLGYQLGLLPRHRHLLAHGVGVGQQDVGVQGGAGKHGLLGPQAPGGVQRIQGKGQKDTAVSLKL